MRSMQVTEQKPLDRGGRLKPADIPIPDPGPGQIQVRVHTCGVCRTDLHILEGDILPPRLPIVPGHQVVGVIEKVGQGVKTYKSGDRVGVPWLYSSCGECQYCKRGQENLCPSAKFTGFDINGGYEEYMVADARYALPIPSSISDEQAAPLLCAGIIGYRALHLADLQKGETVGLAGFGASAHLALQVARYWGCQVYVFTRSDQHIQHAMELGAMWAGQVDSAPPQQLDRAIIFAPSGELVPKMLDKIRPAGTLAVNAIHMSDIPQMPYRLLYGERTLRSVTNATHQDGVEFLKLAEKIPIQATVTTYKLEDANQALKDLKESKLNGEAVLKI